MALLLLLTLSTLAFADISCDNPLFSVSNWPSNMVRPNYLTTPHTVANQTFCTRYQNLTSTCCNQDAIDTIVTLFKSMKQTLQQNGNKLQGRIRDTFNDYDPANQQADGVTVPNNTGSQGGNQPPQQNSNGTGTNNPQPSGNSGTSSGNAGYPPPPPPSENPEGFNNVDVPSSNLTAPTPQKGRGIHRTRPWVLKMSKTGQTALAQLVRNMSALMGQFAFYMGKCMMTQLQHLTGMLCMGCDPSWALWVSGTGTSININLNDATCSSLSDACLDFVKASQSIPELAQEFITKIQAVISAEIALGNIVASEAQITDLQGLVKNTTQVASLCSTDTDCKNYICQTLSKGTSGIAPDPTQVADPASVSASGRLLSAAVAYQFSSTGFDSVSFGTTATTSRSDTATEGTFIDGVSTTSSPLTTHGVALTLLSLAVLLSFN